MTETMKECAMFIGGFLIFFAMLFGMTMYDSTIKHECRLKAMEKNMPSSDIQTVCK